MSRLIKNKALLNNVLKQVESNAIYPRLSSFLAQNDAWKLPHQTKEYYETNIPETFHDSEYSVNHLFALNNEELNILSKVDSGLCGYLIFPHLKDLRYPQLIKLYVEWLFLFDDYCESVNLMELTRGLQTVEELLSTIEPNQCEDNETLMNTILSERQETMDKFEWFAKLLLCILHKSFKLSYNAKWNKHIISMHKDYLISLIFEKVILADHFDSNQHVDKNHFMLFRYFSGAVHIGLSYSQMLNEEFIMTLDPFSIFYDYCNVNKINEVVKYGDCGIFNNILNFMSSDGYHKDIMNAHLSFNAVQSVNYFNELIGFRRDVKDKSYPFNSVFINSSCNDSNGSIASDQAIDQLSIGYDSAFNSFDSVNSKLNRYKCPNSDNLKSFVYGINLWQFVAARYK